MLNTAYISNTNITISETFIYDLIKDLILDSNIRITYVSGQKAPLQTDLNIANYSVGYWSHKQIFALRLYKLGQLKGARGARWQMSYKKRIALKQLERWNLPVFDVAYIEYATSGVLVMEFLEKYRIPFVVHVHGYDITTSLNDNAYYKQLKILFKKAKAFIAASEYMKTRLILLGCEESKIHVIRLGVNHLGINPLSWEERKRSPPSIIFLGRLTEKKNPIALIHAFYLVRNEVPDATLSIIGDGPLRKEVEETIASLCLSHAVKLFGALDRKKSFPLLNKHWIYAQHSVTSITGDTEGFAISIAEAALHELPVVSTIHNGITENVKDGKTGFLVPEYNYKEMANKIVFLIKNPKIAEKMGKEGRKHILQLCNPEQRVDKIKALLIKLATKSE